MTDISRRDWVKTMGVVSAGALAAPDLSILTRTVHAPGDIVDLTSTSEIFTPPRGRSYMKFSFDFPEPSVVFGDYRFGFLVFTDENTYGLDRSKTPRRGLGDGMRITCDGFVWAGGQEKAPGRLVATLKRNGSLIEWDTVVEMERPIKTVSTIVRGVPRGQVSTGGGGFTDPRDGELLAGLHLRRGRSTRTWRRRGDDDAAAHDPGVAHRRVLHLVARRSRAAQALLPRAGRDELSRRSHL